jgi:hypothetical protein
MRFSLKQLFADVTLVGLGFGSLLGAKAVVEIEIGGPEHPIVRLVQFLALVVLWVGSGAAFGAAIGLLVGRLGAGICLGVITLFLIGLRWLIPAIQ